MVFSVMMVIKGMSYALNNPTKEILYQVISMNILHLNFLFVVGNVFICTAEIYVLV